MAKQEIVLWEYTIRFLFQNSPCASEIFTTTHILPLDRNDLYLGYMGK